MLLCTACAIPQQSSLRTQLLSPLPVRSCTRADGGQTCASELCWAVCTNGSNGIKRSSVRATDLTVYWTVCQESALSMLMIRSSQT